MRGVFATVAFCVFLAWPLRAADPDPKLATMTTAFVLPQDPLGDDLAVARCLAEQLGTVTPIKAVLTAADADAVFLVHATITSEAKRRWFPRIGDVRLRVTGSADGALWWEDSDIIGMKSSTARHALDDPACALAEVITRKFLQAMRKARGRSLAQ